MTREELEEKIAMIMGGRAAEKLVFGHLSTGAADDLIRAPPYFEVATVLGADDGGVFGDEVFDLGGERGESVGFDAEIDDVEGAGGGEVAGDGGVDFEIAFGAEDAEAALLHGGEVGAAGVEGDVLTGFGHFGADVASDGSGAGY